MTVVTDLRWADPVVDSGGKMLTSKYDINYSQSQDGLIMVIELAEVKQTMLLLIK